ncbi:GSCOCG00000627001-RA-CDS [Cotesia congregata]|nr:GSCOCG00000627001-RA-CDS [Cotesia congregata]
MNNLTAAERFSPFLGFSSSLTSSLSLSSSLFDDFLFFELSSLLSSSLMYSLLLNEPETFVGELSFLVSFFSFLDSFFLSLFSGAVLSVLLAS